MGCVLCREMMADYVSRRNPCSRGVQWDSIVLEPSECYSDLFDVTYFKVDDQEIEQLVDARARAFCDLFDKRPSGSVQPTKKTEGCLSISFYSMKAKSRQTFWNFLAAEEKIVFEHWRIPISMQPLKKCINPAETLDQEGYLQRLAQEQLRERLHWCIQKVNSKFRSSATTTSAE